VPLAASPNPTKSNSKNVPPVNSFHIAMLHVRKHTGHPTKKLVNEELPSCGMKYCSSNRKVDIWGIVRFVFYHYHSKEDNALTKHAAVPLSAMDVSGLTEFHIGMIPTLLAC
jgi:hypothetical protein